MIMRFLTEEIPSDIELSKKLLNGNKKRTEDEASEEKSVLDFKLKRTIKNKKKYKDSDTDSIPDIKIDCLMNSNIKSDRILNRQTVNDHKLGFVDESPELPKPDKIKDSDMNKAVEDLDSFRTSVQV